MALSNRERVDRGIELLKEGLVPFVEREMRQHRGKTRLDLYSCSSTFLRALASHIKSGNYLARSLLLQFHLSPIQLYFRIPPTSPTARRSQRNANIPRFTTCLSAALEAGVVHFQRASSGGRHHSAPRAIRQIRLIEPPGATSPVFGATPLTHICFPHLATLDAVQIEAGEKCGLGILT